jgi:hypothetical protein
MCQHRAKKAAQQTSIAQQQIKIFLDVRLARANFGERSVNGLQNDDIHGRNPK